MVPRARRFTFSFSPISIFEVCFHTWGTAPFCQLWKRQIRRFDIEYAILKKICERDTDEAYAGARTRRACLRRILPRKILQRKMRPARGDARIITHTLLYTATECALHLCLYLLSLFASVYKNLQVFFVYIILIWVKILFLYNVIKFEEDEVRRESFIILANISLLILLQKLFYVQKILLI